MMKKWFAGACIPLLLVVILTTAPYSYATPPRVSPPQVLVIDPAHGGKDAGVGVSEKLQEKNVTLAIAIALQRELQKSENLVVRLTRDRDLDVSRAARIKLVRDWHPDVFIGIHVNAGFGKGASGYELYFPGFNLPASSAAAAKSESQEILQDMTKNKYLNSSVRLAQGVQRQMERVFPRKGRGLRDAPLVILDDLTIPAVVVEIGFATNTADREKITDPNTQRAVVRALGNSIKEYLR
jgi:N-acetylmuramoyl-L-alanine amidase